MKQPSSPWFWRVYSTVANSNLLVLVRLLTTRVRNFLRYVWLHFVGPHSRKKRSNKHEVAVAHSGTLRACYSGGSIYRIYTSNNPSYAWLCQAFDHWLISDCEGFRHIPRCTRWPHRLFRQFIESELPHRILVLRLTNSAGWLLHGKEILLLPTRRSVVHCNTISQIYRCSVVWQHNIWIIIIPILLWISCAGKLAMNPQQRVVDLFSNLVSGVGAITSYSKVSLEAQVSSPAGWVIAFIATTLATNVICTCTSSYWEPWSPLLTLRIQLWPRSVSGLLIGPVGSIVKQRARSSPC